MTNFEREKFELDLKTFASMNFEKPAKCRDFEQIRLYMAELCHRIKELEGNFNHLPKWAYSLLARYNAKQPTLIFIGFKNTYC